MLNLDMTMEKLVLKLYSFCETILNLSLLGEVNSLGLQKNNHDKIVKIKVKGKQKVEVLLTLNYYRPSTTSFTCLPTQRISEGISAVH